MSLAATAPWFFRWGFICMGMMPGREELALKKEMELLSRLERLHAMDPGKAIQELPFCRKRSAGTSDCKNRSDDRSPCTCRQSSRRRVVRAVLAPENSPSDASVLGAAVLRASVLGRIRASGAKRRRCSPLMPVESLRKSMRLHGPHGQAVSRLPSQDDLVRLQRAAAQAGGSPDPGRQGHGPGRVARWAAWMSACVFRCGHPSLPSGQRACPRCPMAKSPGGWPACSGRRGGPRERAAPLPPLISPGPRRSGCRRPHGHACRHPAAPSSSARICRPRPRGTPRPRPARPAG